MAAIQTQGTSVYVSTGTTGTAVNITGISKAASAVVSAAGHTYVVGDVVEISGVTGMVGANGQWIVTAVATGNFTINYDSAKADAWVSGGSVKKMVIVSGCGVKSFSGFDGSSNEIDTTTFCSVAKEYELGLPDLGNVSFDVNWLPDAKDPWQAEMRKANADKKVRAFLIILPEGAGTTFFRGRVASAPRSAGVDGVHEGSFSVRITGEAYDLAP